MHRTRQTSPGKIGWRALLAVLLAVTLSGCRKEISNQPILVPVRTAEVQTIDTGVGNTYSANIQPYQQVDLAFKSNGYLASIRQVRDADGHIRNIDQGDYVTKGTVLANVQAGRLPAEAGPGQGAARQGAGRPRTRQAIVRKDLGTSTR